VPGLAGEAGAAAGRPGGSGGAAGPARRRVWLPRSLPPRSPLGARPGRGLGAASLHLALRAVASGCVGRSLLGRRSVLAPAGVLPPCSCPLVPARRRVWLRRSLPPRSPLGARLVCGLRAGPGPPRFAAAGSLRSGPPLALPCLRAVASPFVGRFLLARRSVLGPALPLAASSPPGRGCAPSRRPSSVASSLPAARCSGLRSARVACAPWPWLRAFASPFVGRSLVARRSVLGPLRRQTPPGRPAATSSHSRQPRHGQPSRPTVKKA